MDKNKFDTTFLVEIGFRVRLVSFRKGGGCLEANIPFGRCPASTYRPIKKKLKNVEIKCFLVYRDGQI